MTTSPKMPRSAAEQDAETYGIDLALLDYNLRLIPTQRLEQHETARALVKELNK